MSAILSVTWLAGWGWLIRSVVAGVLVLAGVLLTIWSLSRRTVTAKAPD
jgi:hypothetical protein